MLWQAKRISHQNFIRLLSVIVGVMAGIAAVIIRSGVKFIESLLTGGFDISNENLLYFALPTIGILLVILFIRFVVRDNVGHGVPGILYAISRNNGIIGKHNTYSTIVASTLTAGFGGSIGLEGPSVFTGAALGSYLGQKFRLSYKDLTLLLTVACTAGLAAIFKSPIAAIVFSLEVIMIDLTMASLIPLLIASVTGVLTSYFFLGNAVLYPFEVLHTFQFRQIPYFLLLGAFTGLISVYFSKIFRVTERFFALFKFWGTRLIVGGGILGLLVFFFPSLFGEGYQTVNVTLQGDYSPLFNHSPFFNYQDRMWMVFLLLLLVILFKVIATAVTFGAGGVGGIFAPSLFIGVFAGLLFAEFFNYMGFTQLPVANFAMVGMCGILAGIMSAPLTGIFLVAEITQGYELIIPLMIVATISYATTKIFVKNSVYTELLAEKGELFTHHRDKTVLSMLKVSRLIETDFIPLLPEASLRDLVKVISESRRNIYPVVDAEGNFKGFIRLDDVRHIIFKQELYDAIGVGELMVMPVAFVDPDDSMETVAQKFIDYDKYNLPVVKKGKYIGFISRANVFATYRKMVKDFSED